MEASLRTGVSYILENKLSISLIGIAIYALCTAIYRRHFHPLARIPGPALAAITSFYHLYHSRRFYLVVEKLHQEHGPIVRTGPNEVHLAGVEHHDAIYHVGSKYRKWAPWYDAMSVKQSTFGTIDIETHRIRRGALSPFFSRGKVLELEDIVQDKAAKVCALLEASDGSPVDLHHAFRAVGADVISKFAFDNCYNLLDQPDVGAPFFETLRAFAPPFYVFLHFPYLHAISMSIPPWLAPYISKDLGTLAGMQTESIRQIEVVKQKMRARDKGSTSNPGENKERETIFSTLLTPEDKPDGYIVPNTMQVKDEAYAVLFAATDTTGHALSVATFHILYEEQLYARLASELVQRFPYYNKDTELPFVELEKLPFLTAVIKETLRISFGVPFRLPRVVPTGGAEFNGYFVPEGTIIGVSQWLLHRDPDAFPDPMKFDPDRWMKGPEETRRLEKYAVPFGRGSRQCLGLNLAYSELYITLGTLFRRLPEGLKIWRPQGTRKLMGDFDDFITPFYTLEKRDDWLKAYVEKRS